MNWSVSSISRLTYGLVEPDCQGSSSSEFSHLIDPVCRTTVLREQLLKNRGDHDWTSPPPHYHSRLQQLRTISYDFSCFSRLGDFVFSYRALSVLLELQEQQQKLIWCFPKPRWVYADLIAQLRREYHACSLLGHRLVLGQPSWTFYEGLDCGCKVFSCPF